MANTSALQVSFEPTVVTSLSGVTLRAAPLAAPNVVLTTPVEVTFAQAGTTIVPIVDADTSSQSVLGLGSGSVSDNDLILWRTVSGDSSNLTINPNGTWQFSTAPSEDVVIGIMVYSQQNGTTGAAGQITFDTNGVTHVLENVILRPAGLTLASSPVQIVHGEQVSFTFDDVATAPTSGNTRIFLGGITGIEITSFSSVNDYGNRYTFTFSVPTDSVIRYGDKSVLFVVGGQTYTSAAIPFVPQAGSYYVSVVNPELSEQWSVFNGYTGDDPETGGQLVWTINSIQSGLTAGYLANGALQVSVIGGGEVVLTENISIDVYYISTDDQKGDTATKTFETDLVAPVITLTGPATIELGYGESYIELGATANDDKDGDITDDIQITNDIDLNNSGTYTVSYNVQDGARNDAATVTRTVNVVPQRLVVIDSIVEARNSATVNFSYSGADITGIEYRVNGSAWQSTNNPLTINGLDPETSYSFEIRPFNGLLIGQITSATITTLAGVDNTPDAFSFTPITGQALGAYAVSNTVAVSGVDVGLDIPVSVTDGEYSVSTDGGATWGAWTTTATNVRLNYVLRVRHLASDQYITQVSTALDVGGVSAVFSSTTTANQPVPVITRTTTDVLNLDVGSSYQDPPWTAADDLGPVDVVWTGLAVNTSAAGTYTRIATASNLGGDAIPLSYTIIVSEPVDNTRPVLRLVGSSAVFHDLGVVYTDEGATATDNRDGDLTDEIITTGSVDFNNPSQYILTYNVTDAAGNQAFPIQRSVTVRDAIAPVIALNGDEEITLALNEPYTEPQGIVTDNIEGQIPWSRVVITGSVDVTTEGIYTLFYDVQDISGLSAVQRQRRVIVGNPVEETLEIKTPTTRTLFVNPNGESYQPIFAKDAGDVLDYAIDFTAILQDDVIASASVKSKSVVVDDYSHSDRKVQAWLSGGIERVAGLVVVTATTESGRTIERSFKVKIGEY